MNIVKQIFNKNVKNFQLNIQKNQDDRTFKIPDRYRIKKGTEGDVLTCVEAPNITVKIQRGFVVSLNEAKRFPERSIFLDGAARGEPFLDNERQIYNLDHHEGCERTFTLSTCEQAIILVRKGLNLKEKNWTIYANEPDLDTILAIWVFLNHIHLSSGDSKQYKKIIPLIRMEGVIDALGLELIDIIAFPSNLFKETKNKIDKLREEEEKIKKEGLWNTINFAEYTHRILNKIDHLAFEAEDIQHLRSVVEIARAEITDEDSVVVFEGDLGIYELEEYLNKIYNKKPTFVILRKDKNTYTIRKGDMFSPLNLEKIYERLNIFDKNVNGKIKENRWGGSSQIGGSPRLTGTALTPNQIVEICKNAYYEPDKGEIFRIFIRSFFIGIIPHLLSWIFIFIALFSSYFHHLVIYPMGIKIDVFYYFFLLALVYYFYKYIIHSMHVFGFRYPVGFKWLRWVVVSIFFGIMGGIWIPYEFFLNKNFYYFLVSFIFGPVLTSILYFSYIHGIMIFYFPIQRYEGNFFLSKPSLFTSIIYTIATFIIPFYQFPFFAAYNDITSLWYALLKMPFIFFYALFLCFIRERSESIYPVIFTHLTLHILFVIFYLFFK
ncbi:MAG: hypothetical protein KatS3mg129_1865 [Leptospiraceae bacterium]|nr:MAG: hypothetical protein KatS3mg129_1865 [Leptospiraceae bacterium]